MPSLSPWQDAARAALQTLIAAGADFAEVFLEQNRSTRLRVENGALDQAVDGGEFGAGLRLVRGERTWFACTNDVTPAGLQAAARELAAGAGKGAEAVLRLSAAAGRSLPAERAVGRVPAAERLAAAMAAERGARGAGPHIRQVSVGLSGFEQAIAVANSEGLWREDERRQLVLRVQAVAADDSGLQTGYEAAGGTRGWEFFAEHDPAEVGRLAGERAERLLAAPPAPSGRLCVVLAGEAGGTMIHEAVGHALEADLVLKGLSVFGGRLGQAIASPLISVADDPTLGGWRGSYGCDDEGTPARRNLLVERGVLRGYLSDRLTARQGGWQPSGNGRRESYAYRPIPRMSNTMILPGEDDPAEILRAVPDGLYVTRMGGGQVNTVNGDFVFEVSDAHRIRGGELAETVRGASLIGNAEQVLRGIDRVGRDHGQGIGTCGKDGQGVPVADAQPTLRIPEITVGGAS